MTGGRILGALLVAAAASVAHAVEVPPLTGRVVDGAGILGVARERLGALLADHEARTTTQIAVLTMPTLGGEPIEEAGLRIANAWGLGQKDKDNGVLVLVVPLDRRMRIEVGRGLEEALPDAEAKRILDEVMAPAFRGGDFAGGVERGIRAIIERLDGYEAAERGVNGGAEPPPRSGAWWLAPGVMGVVAKTVLFGAFALFVAGLYFLAWAARGVTAGFWSSVVSPLADPDTDHHRWAAGPWRSPAHRTGSSFDAGCAGGGSSGSNWSSSSSWASSSSWSSSSSSGSSGSGFSGGGGSSSGRGASGSW